MENNYTYPVILDYSEKDYINIKFPSFDNAITCVEKGEDYISNAQDYLALLISDYEQEGKDVPESMFDNIAINTNEKLVYINIWMPYHRNRIKEVYVKKTLTIPAWLDELAKKNNINFSATLTEGLKTMLNLK